MADIAYAAAGRLAGLIRRKKIGALELLDHYLARVDKYNPAINALVVMDVERARARAKEADRALAKGEVWGPFHGVPMTVKESFQVEGLPTTWGLPAFKDNIATKDAVAVQRWRQAGAVIFGKSNVPVMLADGQSFNPVYGRTNNPRDLGRTPGGSSGGSAAAVAAGLTAIEMGSDIASSIRNPAHNNNIFGHKPTWGLISSRGNSLADTYHPTDISVVGPLARTADDLALALGVLAGPDVVEAAGLRYDLPAPRHKALKDYKIGFIVSDPISEVSEDVQAVLFRLMDWLGQQGAVVSDRARPAIDFFEVERISATLLAAATGARQPQAEFEEQLKAAKKLSADDHSPAAYAVRGQTLHHRDWIALDEERWRLRMAWHDWFKEYDLLLCPVYPLAPHEHIDEPTKGRRYRINGNEVGHGKMIFWAGLSGVAYLPSTAAPAGFTAEGLPVGVQIVGPHLGDRQTIAFAKLLEREWQKFVPPKGFP